MLATQSSGARVIAIRGSYGVDQLLDALEDAVVAITVAGVVRYANPAARNTLGAQLEAIGRHPEVLAMLRDARTGKIFLPQKLALQFDGADSASLAATLTTGPLGTDFALVIAR
jgi:PAS domain-containing protein